jgi:hypothetical protein
VVFSELKGLGTTVPDARLGNLWKLGPIEELASAWGRAWIRTEIRTVRAVAGLSGTPQVTTSTVWRPNGGEDLQRVPQALRRIRKPLLCPPELQAHEHFGQPPLPVL